jgi:hypothetical protein
MKSCKTCAFEESSVVRCGASVCLLPVRACVPCRAVLCVVSCRKCVDFSKWVPIGCIRVEDEKVL